MFNECKVSAKCLQRRAYLRSTLSKTTEWGKKLPPLTFIRRQLFKARSGDLMTKTCLQLNRQQIAILEKRFENFCLRRNLKKS